MYSKKGFAKIGTESIIVLIGAVSFIVFTLFAGKILSMGKDNVDSANQQASNFVSLSNSKITEFIQNQ